MRSRCLGGGVIQAGRYTDDACVERFLHEPLHLRDFCFGRWLIDVLHRDRTHCGVSDERGDIHRGGRLF